MTEPGAGSDLQAIRTRAERHGNQYAINGSKTFISNGFLAGLVVVVCKTDPSERARGISLMLVETGDCAGFRVGRLLDKIGRKAQVAARTEALRRDRTPTVIVRGRRRHGPWVWRTSSPLPCRRSARDGLTDWLLKPSHHWRACVELYALSRIT
jgi:hypothetical protein